MYMIQTTTGERVAIFAAHVVSVEMKQIHSECVVTMVNGRQYVTEEKPEVVIKGLADAFGRVSRAYAA